MADAEDVSSSASSSSLSPPTSPPQHQLPAKRRAGRKKFRETRHPVYRGVRARAGGSRWVCEVREPQAQARIWLGTYPTPEMAARAHDVAAIALRGAGAADLNFPDSARTLPRPRTAAPDDIRCAAAQAAELYRPASAHTTSSSSTAAPPRPLLAVALAPLEPPEHCFLDEDAVFDMPGLIDDMARGMLLTPPPAIGSWAAVDDDVDCTLWMDDDY